MRSVNSFVRFSDGPKLDTPHHDNIIYLPGQPEGDCHSVLSLAGKGVAHMYVTWSDLISFMLMLVAIITLVNHWNDKHKK